MIKSMFLLLSISSLLAPPLVAADLQDTSAIKLVVSVVSYDGAVESWEGVTLNEREISFGYEDHHPYVSGINTKITSDVAISGFRFTSTPSLRHDGNIHIDFSLIKNELKSMENIEFDGQSIQSPNINHMALEQNVIVVPGKEVSIPFGGRTIQLKAITVDL